MERPGNYTLWIQELATGSYAYRFNIVLAAVPGPNPLALMLAGLLPLLALRRRA